MSLILATGFDHNVYAERFNLAGSISSNGRFGRGRYARFSNGNHYCNVPLLPDEQHNSYVVGFASRDTASPYTNLSYASSLIEVYGDTGQRHLAVFWTSPESGQYLIRASGENTLQDSSPIQLSNGPWHYWEIKFTIDESAGSVEVRRDGITILNVSNVDTRNGGADANVRTIRFGQNANNSYGSLDDVYILKNDGSGKTDFLGEIEVEALVPDGNGNYSDLTGSDGDSIDNYLHVDDNTSVNDSNYVGSPNDGDKDTYSLSGLVRTSTVIHGLHISHRSRKSDTSNKSMRRVLRSGGSDDTGDDVALIASFVWYQEILEQNPVSGLGWTHSDVDNLEVGVEVRP